MAINVISYNGTDYEDNAIEQATAYGETTYVGDTLPYSTLDADVWDYGKALLQYCTNDDIVLYQPADGLWMFTQQRSQDLTAYTYGAPVIWTYKGQLLMQRFLTSCKRIGKYKFRLSCVSGVGLISESRHYGGLYNGTLFGDMLADVISGAFDYQIDEDVAAIPMYGWLPVDTRRQNLWRMLTASGVVIRTNPQGQIWFTSPSTANPTPIPDSQIEINGSVDYPTPFQAVKVTEHAFVALSTDILKTLFDGQVVAEQLISPLGARLEGALVTFQDPMHDLSITGGTILESGVNYAVLGPSANCTLTGLVYSHTERIVTAGSLSATEQATKRLEDSTLVNLFNSSNVAQRWFLFYSSPRTVQMTAVWDGIQPNDPVSFSDPYDDPILGVISELDVRMSAKLTADMTVLSGKLPELVGNFYSNVVVITTNTTWTVPSTTKGKIRVVLISGGEGGSSGYKGSDVTQTIEQGTNTEFTPEKYQLALPILGGSGGQPGNPGAGGRIYQVEIVVSAGQQFAISIGVGGDGGVNTPENSNQGQQGTDTTFGNYSSASGGPVSSGYFDPIQSITYALPGSQGVPGGAGTGVDENGDIQTESVTWNGTTYNPGNNLNDQSTEKGAGNFTVGAGYVFAFSSGGYGGGAAAGQNGEDGSTYNEVTASAGDYTAIASAQGGNGGTGANAAPPIQPSIHGTGGGGGNGGGGGGSPGRAYAFNRYESPATGTADLNVTASSGLGGLGSNGGNGAPGVALIYY